MHFDDRAVEANRFDLHADELLMLQLLEQPIEHTGLRPAVHPGVDRVPGAEAFRQGNLGIMDYYRMKNIQADSAMRESIGEDGSNEPGRPGR